LGSRRDKDALKFCKNTAAIVEGVFLKLLLSASHPST
jgi:hypothetical protein